MLNYQVYSHISDCVFKLFYLRATSKLKVPGESKKYTKYKPISQREIVVYNGRFQTFNSCYSYEKGWMWLKFCKALVIWYSLPYQQFFLAFGLLILVFEIPPLYTSSLLLCNKDM